MQCINNVRRKTMRSKTDREICGNCEHWTGERTPIFDRNGVPKNDIKSTAGDCTNPMSHFCDNKRARDYKCKHFSKWTELL